MIIFADVGLTFRNIFTSICLIPLQRVLGHHLGGAYMSTIISLEHAHEKLETALLNPGA